MNGSSPCELVLVKSCEKVRKRCPCVHIVDCKQLFTHEASSGVSFDVGFEEVSQISVKI